MRRTLVLFFVLAILLTGVIVATPAVGAAGPEWVVVGAGETLAAIAARYGTTVQALVKANNLPNANFVYSGQRLLIPPDTAPDPPGAASSAPTASAQPPKGIYYNVRPGESLAAVAARFGVSASAIAEANHLKDWNFVWYGQRLLIPGVQDLPVAAPPTASADKTLTAPRVPNPPTTGKWIDVNVSNQTITAYEGGAPIKTVVVSTGLPRTPTVLGSYRIYSKYPAVHMVGGTPGYDYYDLPNVPYTMFFFEGYAIHGTYWHNNFGHPMSHGCVNLPTPEAKWFYEWAPVGTPVIVHEQA